MFFLPVILAAAPIATTAPATPARNADAECQVNRIVKTGDTAKPLVHPLNAEPAAQSLYAVVREVGGCNRPIVLSPSVGQPPVR